MMQNYIKFRKGPNNLLVFSNFAVLNVRSKRYRFIVFLIIILIFIPVQSVYSTNDEEVLNIIY